METYKRQTCENLKNRVFYRIIGSRYHPSRYFHILKGVEAGRGCFRDRMWGSGFSHNGRKDRKAVVRGRSCTLYK